MHSFVYSFVRLRVRPLIHSGRKKSTYKRPGSFVCSSAFSFTRSSICSFVRCSFIRPFVGCCQHSLIQRIIRSFARPITGFGSESRLQRGELLCMLTVNISTEISYYLPLPGLIGRTGRAPVKQFIVLPVNYTA